jgi:hypothetical protein
MRQLLAFSFFVCTLLASGSVLGQAQQRAAPSLGDLAKQLQAQREKAGQKPKVYSNDNLPAQRPDQGFRIAPSLPAVPVVTGAAGSTPGAKGGHDEKYFRTRMSELRAQLEQHQRQLNVLQQKLGQGEMQFYTDPNKGLQQQYSRSDVTKGNEDIQKKQQAVADDQKAMDDLRDQLRREGGDPGWLR